MLFYFPGTPNLNLLRFFVSDITPQLPAVAQDGNSITNWNYTNEYLFKFFLYVWISESRK